MTLTLLALLCLPLIDHATFAWWRGRKYRRMSRAAADAAILEGE